MKVGESMKESGLMIKDMEWALKSTRILMNTLGISKEGKLMGKGSTYGIIVVNYMKEVGLMDSSMDMVVGKVSKYIVCNSSSLDNDGESYVGDWRDNKANGKGVHIWANGDKYEGDWLDFLKHGFGTDHFANGDSYSG
jgi:hypothetical protein